jgi:predicted phosphoribosyltransferase
LPFANRTDAGERLAEALARYRGQDPVVLALPRGGVPVAREVARALNAPLDLILVRKIGVPAQPELAMGAVVDGAHPMTVRNADVIAMAGITEKEFAQARDRQLAEIARRRAAYLGDRPHPKVAGRIAIVVDDGIATGATVRVALAAVREQSPSRLVLAVPVAPTSTLAELRDEVDEVVCLEVHEDFGAIGYFYDDFSQVSAAEVRSILAEFPVSANAEPRAVDGT